MFLFGLGVGLGLAFIAILITRAFVKGGAARALDRATTLPDNVKQQVKSALKL